MAPEFLAKFTEGQRLEGFQMEVSQERINAYAEGSGDFNPIHLDPQFAANSMFKGVVAHGMLGLALVARMFSANFGRQWGQQAELRAQFRNPVPVDTTVTVSGQVEEIGSGGQAVVRGECLLPDGSPAVTVTLNLKGQAHAG